MVSQESLVDAREFHKHEAMLNKLLNSITDGLTLKSAADTARGMLAKRVVWTIVDRLRQVKPKLANKLEHELEQEPLESSLQLQDQVDREEDERLADLEDPVDSDDENFIDDSLDENMLEDDEYTPESEEDSDDDSSGSEATSVDDASSMACEDDSQEW